MIIIRETYIKEFVLKKSMEKQCLKKKLEETGKDRWKKFKDFGDNCLCLNTFNNKCKEFRKTNTTIQLGINEMEKNCAKKEKKECPSDFCSELF